MNNFWGMKIVWIFLCGHYKIGLYLGVISMLIFFGVLGIPDMFLGERQMLGPNLRMEKKIRVPSGYLTTRSNLTHNTLKWFF